METKDENMHGITDRFSFRFPFRHLHRILNGIALKATSIHLLRAIPFEILSGGRTGKNSERPPKAFSFGHQMGLCAKNYENLPSINGLREIAMKVGVGGLNFYF